MKTITDDQKEQIEAMIRRIAGARRGLTPVALDVLLDSVDYLLRSLLEERPGDDPTGAVSAPKRYSGMGRETIDRIRDKLGDTLFLGFCLGNVIKYTDRAGLKDDAQQDWDKALFYSRMGAHVDGRGPDPRASRKGFVAYKRNGRALWPVKEHCWCQREIRTCDHGSPDDLTDLECFNTEGPTAEQGAAWERDDRAWEIRDGLDGWRSIVPYEGATCDWLGSGEMVRPVQRFAGKWLGRPWTAIPIINPEVKGE